LAGKRKVYDEAMAMAANYTWDQDWPNAVKSYRAALEEFPQNADALAGLGTAYFELAQYESAVRSLQRALQADPTNHEAMNKIGEALEKLGRFDDATKTYIYSGNMFAKAGQLESAISVWQKALQINPDLIQARNNLAKAYAQAGEKEKAVAELITLAAIYQGQADHQRARQYLHGALQLAPGNEYAIASQRALENGASIRSVKAEMDRAPRVEAELVEETPATEEELFSLTFDGEEEEEIKTGNPRERANEMALAELANVLFEDESKYNQQLSINLLELGAYISQAIDWQTRGELDEAIKLYEQIIEAGFTHAAAYFALANLHIERGHQDQAITCFNQAKQEKKYLLGANFALGECYKAMGNANQALRHFVEVLKTIDLENSNRTSTKELEQLYTALLDNYISRGDDERTMAFVESLIDFLSSQDWEHKIARARRSLGVDDGAGVSAWIEFLEAGQAEIILSSMANTAEYLAQNMPLTAAEECYWAIQHAPNYLPLHMRLAEIYLKQDRIEEGINKYLAVTEIYQVRENMNQVISIYQKILKIAPMDITVRNKLIELNIEQGNFDAAMEHHQILADAYYQLAQVNQSLKIYQEALKLAPRTSNPRRWQIDILYNLGDIYTQRVDWRNAAQVYEQLIKIAPEDDKALSQLVDLYFKLNELERALNALDKLMALYNKQQKQTKALQVLQELVNLRPQELALRKKLALFYANLSMTKQALEQYNKLSEMQLEAGLPDDAAHTIETILQLGPDNLDYYQRLLAQIKGGI